MPLWSRHPSAPARVLVIDDDAALRGSVVRVLRRAGYAVEDTDDARWALERMTRGAEPVDVVLCDVVMPLLNGIVFGERLRERGIEVPIAYISGLAEESALRDWGIPPSTPFLAKPFEPRDLVALVERLAAGPGGGGARARGSS